MSKLDKILTDFTNNVQYELLNKFDEFQLYMVTTIWQSISDLILCLLLSYIYWCCFCMMMCREKVSLPPFGEAKLIDTLYFVGLFYFVMKLAI